MLQQISNPDIHAAMPDNNQADFFQRWRTGVSGIRHQEGAEVIEPWLTTHTRCHHPSG